MPPLSIKKRFIAGATCPKCHLVDKMVVYNVANKEFLECVRCGYKEEAPFENKPKATEKKEQQKIIWLSRDK